MSRKQLFNFNNKTRSVYTERRISRSQVIAVIFIFAIWYILIGKELLTQLVTSNLEETEVTSKVYYDLPCSEANLARIISITLGETTDSEIMQDSLVDAAIEDSRWYAPYYEQTKEMGITSLKEENAFQLLSSQQFEKVLSEITSTPVNIRESDKLQLYEVIQIYVQVLNEKGLNKKGQSIEYQSLAMLMTPAEDAALSAWQVATNKGLFHFEGLVVEPLKDKTVQAACVKNEILGIMEIEQTSSELSECKIIEVKDKKAKFELVGRTFSYNNKVLKEEDVGKVGCLTVEDGSIKAFTTEMGQKVDTLLSISNQDIYLEKAGRLIYHGISIDDLTGKDQYKTLRDLTYGLKVAYREQNGEVTRLQVVGESPIKEIRVLLSQSSGDYLHESVQLVAKGDYDMLYAGKAESLKDGTRWDADQFSWQKKHSVIRFIPRTSEDRLQVKSLHSKGGEEDTPGYGGVIEVTKREEGYVLINEVDMESYVLGVLPSEMPSYYELEALEAQAIAIRTYGENCRQRGNFIAYGAHVDDTTASQVYNRIEPNDKVIEAVSNTKGLVLKFDGELINNKFFAASCGYTANSGEVWTWQNFPSNTPSYLVSRQQYLGEAVVNDLQKEENFRTFIQLSDEELDAFDEDSPWFRWHVTLSKEALSALIDPALEKLRLGNKSYIRYESKAGIETKEPVHDLGRLCHMEIMERGQGGNAMALKLEYEKVNVIIYTEYVIRSLFASNENQDLQVIRADQSVVSQLTLLPSAFFIIEEQTDEKGQLSGVKLVGGGNGHGVGLSQDGAQGMAKRGYQSDEILKHYYSDCEIVTEK